MQVIRIRGARQNNLKNVSVDLPRGKLVVVSGPSGSGKSSLVFDTLYAEGQRRYVESLSTYTKQFLERLDKPDVDEVSGISPAIAIRQQNRVKSARSTVGTVTEVSDFLRLLFSRVGEPHCPKCDRLLQPEPPTLAAPHVLRHFPDGSRVLVVFALQRAGSQSLDDLLEQIRAAGFVRVWHDGRTHELDVPFSLPARTRRLEVVVDRIVARAGERARLAEAIETAYRAGGGDAAVVAADASARLDLTQRARCPTCEIELPEPTPAFFSFNSPLGACADCRGFGNRLEFDEVLVVPDPERTLADGALAPWASGRFQIYAARLEKFCVRAGIPMRVPWRSLPRASQKLLLEGTTGYKGVFPFLEALRAKAYKKYARFFTRRFMTETTCRTCNGGRLRREALCFRIAGRDVVALSQCTLAELQAFVESLILDGERAGVARDVLAELRARLRFLCGVGVEYLSLDRLARTLSGGEAQRINLASALGADLVGALYVLDEPTVGMHARDTDRLVETMEHLRELGNSVVVVEHDLDVIRRADALIDLGPGAGTHGGEIVYAGPPQTTAAKSPPAASAGRAEDSRTLAYLARSLEVSEPAERRPPGNRWIEIRRARLHNLKDIDVRFPLGLLVCVTGVSGSGKSTLVSDVLYKALTGLVQPSRGAPGWFDAITGTHLVRDVVFVDAAPIGRTPRSNPVSYMKALTDIRALLASTTDARVRRIGAGQFSFNTPGGRCETCEGMGYQQIEMHFMADLFVKCDQCDGQRFQPHVLEVRYRGRNVAQILDLTVDEALSFFHDTPGLGAKLYVLKRAGLGYLRLGQPAPTLSGGESQRLKIARALASKQQGNLLYILDEPTSGLHLDDVSRLLRTLHELVERGHTVLLIEHHLDVVRSADWVIDLGPEAGAAGGEVVYTGPPDGLLDEPRSWTGRCLRRHLEAAAPEIGTAKAS